MVFKENNVTSHLCMHFNYICFCWLWPANWLLMKEEQLDGFERKRDHRSGQRDINRKSFNETGLDKEGKSLPRLRKIRDGVIGKLTNPDEPGRSGFDALFLQNYSWQFQHVNLLPLYPTFECIHVFGSWQFKAKPCCCPSSCWVTVVMDVAICCKIAVVMV